MAFPRETVATVVGIGDLQIELFDPKPGSGAQRGIVHVQVIMSDGSIRARSFNLTDHVSPAAITQLQTLAATLRAKAVAEILP